MTVIGGEDVMVQADHPLLGRTFAMTVVTAGYGAMTAGLAYLIFLFLRGLQTADNPEIEAAVPVFVTITVVVAIVGLVALTWSGARRRAWFWAGEHRTRPLHPVDERIPYRL